jgi:hypothetical protein
MITFKSSVNPIIKRKKVRKNIFEQFGFIVKDEIGDHVIGDCPFCKKKDHFFINTKSPNKTWDCKKCLRKGGFKEFVQQMYHFCKEQTNDNILQLLQKDRGNSISIETLRKRVVFHSGTQQYIIHYKNNRGEIIGLKLYNFKSLISAAGFTLDLYGLWNLDEIIASEQIFICEGEWDYMYWYDCLTSLGIDIPIVAVPGAGSLQEHNMILFQNKIVYLLYDNDDAGRKGVERATKMLDGIATDIFKIDWPDTLDNGFDIRDLAIQGEMEYDEAYNYIYDKLIESKVNHNGKVTAGMINSNLCPLEPVPPLEVFNEYQRHLHMPDISMLYIIFSTVLAGRLIDDPLWMIIVAPPGATKTEPILSLSNTWCVETLSTLTPTALISGSTRQINGDPSLIPKLNGRVLIVKDFTAIMSLPQTEREEIIGILRDAYDGECGRFFGNGITRKYNSKFGILAAATPAIEAFVENHSAMGERFLRWRNYLPTSLYKRQVYVQKAIDNVGKGPMIREELSQAAQLILLADYSGYTPIIPTFIKKHIIQLSLLVAQLRAVVPRDPYSKEVVDLTEAELATRLSKEFSQLVIAAAMLGRKYEVGLFEYNLAIQVARSSAPYRVLVILRLVYEAGDKGIRSTEINEKVRLSSATIQILLQNLVILNFIEKEQIVGEKLKKYVYKITDEMRYFITNSKLFS